MTVGTLVYGTFNGHLRLPACSITQILRQAAPNDGVAARSRKHAWRTKPAADSSVCSENRHTLCVAHTARQAVRLRADQPAARYFADGGGGDPGGFSAFFTHGGGFLSPWSKCCGGFCMPRSTSGGGPAFIAAAASGGGGMAASSSGVGFLTCSLISGGGAVTFAGVVAVAGFVVV